MLISLTVGKVDAGVAVLLTEDKRLIEFPSILLPPNISSGSIVDITVSRNLTSEKESQASFVALQDAIYASFGKFEPAAPVLRCRNATQTSVVLEWDPIDLATADILSLSLFRNGQKAGNIPKPTAMQSTKISGLAVDTEYTFHLVLRTSAGTSSSEKVTVRTHKMTDLSGITVTPGILPAHLRDGLVAIVDRIGARIADTVRIDTTHFVTIEGRGMAWEKAVEMNIPVVRPEWVDGCEQSGRIVGVRQYYLDADPRGRQPSMAAGLHNHPEGAPPTPRVPNLPPTIPEGPQQPSSKTASTTQIVPPTPPAKDAIRTESDGDGSGEEALERRRSAVSDMPEQKVRVEDRDQQKVALRPGAPGRASSKRSSMSEDGTERGSVDGEEMGGSGAHTPAGSSFQDVAL